MQNTIDKLARIEKRLQAAKGVEAKALGIDYLLPLFKTFVDDVAAIFAEQGQAIAEQGDAIEQLADGGDADLLEDCRSMIVKLAGLLDEAFVAAGFMKITDKGLVPGQAPGDLVEKYLAIGAEVTELVADLEESINEQDEEDDDGPDGDPGEPAAKPADVLALVPAVAPAAATEQVAVVAAPALEPDSVEPGEPTSTEKGGTATRSTEHDTDAA